MPIPFDLDQLNGTLEGCLRTVIMKPQIRISQMQYVTFLFCFHVCVSLRPNENSSSMSVCPWSQTRESEMQHSEKYR